MIYTLLSVPRGPRWDVVIGIRTTAQHHSEDSITDRRSFETREEAEKWMREEARVLNVLFLPDTIAATSVFLPLGGVIPEDADQ
jgi:hypothetical protein